MLLHARRAACGGHFFGWRTQTCDSTSAMRSLRSAGWRLQRTEKFLTPLQWQHVEEAPCVCCQDTRDGETQHAFFSCETKREVSPFVNRSLSRCAPLCEPSRCLAHAMRSTSQGPSKTCAAAETAVCRGNGRKWQPSLSPAVRACMCMTHASRAATSRVDVVMTSWHSPENSAAVSGKSSLRKLDRNFGVRRFVLQHMPAPHENTRIMPLSAMLPLFYATSTE